MFKEYKYKSYRIEIRKLLQRRLILKDRINYHLKKIKHHRNKISIIQAKILPETEKELEDYLKKAGN